MKHYVTFGQAHVHRVQGKTLDCDTVAVYEAESWEEGREKAGLGIAPNVSGLYAVRILTTKL